MRILQINTEKTWRGGERQTVYTLQGLREAGVEVALLCRDGSPLATKTQSLGIPVHTVSGQLQAALHLATRRSNCHVVHAQTAKGQSLAVLTKWLHRRPVVYTRRVDFVPHGPLTRLKYRWTDQVVAISHPIRRILEQFGVNHVEVIPSAVVRRHLDHDRAARLKQTLGANSKRIIGTVAALVPHKDPTTMVRTVRELASLRQDFVFLHFGDGELRSAIENELKTQRLGNLYRLMGFQEDVEDFFSILEVFVMSSCEEGLGSSVLDAFLYGVPVVSTDAGGLAETVAHRGLLCPVRDHRCLALSIHRLLESGDLRGELAARGHDAVERLYGLQTNIEQYLRVFRRLLPPQTS